MEKRLPVRVEANSAMQFFANVTEKVAQGFDICSPTFVSNGRTLNLYMVKAFCLYEYYLIEAESLKELDQKVQRLVEIGYDFMHGVLLYNGTHLQWMQRMHEKRHADSDNGRVSLVREGMVMVEDARPLVLLEPVPAGFGSFLEKLHEVKS